LLNDDEVLAVLGKYILDNVFSKETGNVKMGDIKEVLRWVDKTLFK
jgi:hypothetical protein